MGILMTDRFRKGRSGRRRMRLSLLAALIAVSLGGIALMAFGIYAVAGGFGPSSGAAWGAKLSLSRTTSGQLVLHVLTCPGEQITNVSLHQSDRIFSTAGQTLWRVSSAGRSTASVFTVGSTPSGFITVTPLVEKPAASQPLILDVDTHFRHPDSFEIDFTVSEVRPGVVFVGGPGLLGTAAYVSLEKFHSVRGEVCRLQPLPPGG